MKTESFIASYKYAYDYARKQSREKVASEKGKELKRVSLSLSTSLGVSEKTVMGLTSDKIKHHPEYQDAWWEYRKADAMARDAGAYFMKHHKAEYARHRKASPNPYRPIPVNQFEFAS